MLDFIASILRTPAFRAGARVNRAYRGHIDRIDGHVIAQRDGYVLVEWPRLGMRWESARTLCQQHEAEALS